MSFVRFARQPQWLPKVVVCLFAAGGPVGCVFNDNGSVFTGSNVGRVIGFSGQSMNPGEQIRVQVLNPSTANPAVAANWTTIGTTNATNNPFDINGTNSYSWSINVTPVANAGQDVRWKAGGLARFRVLGGNGSPLVTFDETSCWIDSYNNGDTPLEIQAACESHAKPILTFVDKDPFPGSGLPYLGLRANSPAQAAAYNTTVDAPDDLADWISSRGFPAGEVVTKYYNRGDLGIGREMHCRQQNNAPALNKPDVACYVTNYGSQEDNLADSNSALADAINGHNPFATVAMDYWSTATNKVRFYTYGPTGDLVTEADLDSEAAKPTPGICLSCHGGTFDGGDDDVVGASFLPFDLENFGFVQPTGGVVLPGPVYTKDGQQEEFRQLNLMVRATNPPAATVELIDGWYGGLVGLQTPGTVQDPTFVPAGWSTEPVAYRAAIAPYCRTCHVALATPGKPTIDFNTSAELGGAALAESYVCSSHIMPHADVTRRLFWASDARAHLAGAFGWKSHCN
ncbi:MAG: hypothetical protein IPG45_37350 [Deltaproteobacteria bacterium]|nr:hypothetical protein [Deltaproteobacteria bacterium]